MSAQERRQRGTSLSAVVLLVGLLSVSACRDVTDVGESAIPRHLQVSAKDDGPEESRIQGAGCGVAFKNGGVLFRAVVPRSRLPQELRRAAGLSENSLGRLKLHVESFDVAMTTPNGTREVAFACVGDRTADRASMRKLVAEGDPSWIQLDRATVAAFVDTSTPLRSVAANALMEPLIARVKQGSWRERHDTLGGQSRPGKLSAWAPPLTALWGGVAARPQSLGTLATVETESAPLGGARARRRDYQLPTVTIIGSQGNWLMNASDIYWLLHAWRSYDGQFQFAGYVDCAQASELYLSQGDEFDRLEADSTELAHAVASTDAFNCEHQGGGLNICMDLFIVTKTAGPLNGDGRGLDSSAPYSASRVQVYLDLDNNVGRAYVNSSSTWVPFASSFNPVDPYPHGPKALQIVTQDATHKIVSYEFYNGYCAVAPQSLCPPTTGSVLFVKHLDGTWVPGDVSRVPYPTLAIYRDTGTSFQVQYNSPETRWTDLFGSHQALQNWRDKMGLPDGCYLQ